MLEISKQLDKTINNWINHHAPNLENVESGIYISEFDDSNSDKRASKIWIFEYKNSLYLSLNKNVKEDLLKLIKKTPRDFLFSDYGKYEISKIPMIFQRFRWYSEDS